MKPDQNLKGGGNGKVVRPMNSHLTFRPREGVVFGVVDGKVFRLTTIRTDANLSAWEGAARRVETTAAGPSIPRAVPVGAAGHRLTIGENSLLEVYDYPGGFAQRFDGIDKGGASHQQHRGRVVWVKLQQRQGFPSGGFHMHGPPPCGNPNCIVMTYDSNALFEALSATRQITIVVEL